MKISLFVFCFLCATAAFGQTGGSLSSQAQPTEFPDHPGHATQHDMATPQDILAQSAYSYAQGERPLWEFGSPSTPVPLGDQARAVRKEHTADKKSKVIWVN